MPTTSRTDKGHRAQALEQYTATHCNLWSRSSGQRTSSPKVVRAVAAEERDDVMTRAHNTERHTHMLNIMGSPHKLWWEQCQHMTPLHVLGRGTSLYTERALAQHSQNHMLPGALAASSSTCCVQDRLLSERLSSNRVCKSKGCASTGCAQAHATVSNTTACQLLLAQHKVGCTAPSAAQARAPQHHVYTSLKQGTVQGTSPSHAHLQTTDRPPSTQTASGHPSSTRRPQQPGLALAAHTRT